MSKTIAVLGVGRVGSAVARTALEAGYAVTVAGSGSAADIALLVDIVILGARALSASEAVADADIVILAVPLHKYRTIDPRILDGKVVIDAMNHWAPIDGTIEEFDADPRSTSEIVSQFFDGALVVKALNHIGYHELEEDARRDRIDGRRALAFATDHDSAALLVTELLSRFGFDPVSSGLLYTGAAFEPGTEIFSGSFDRDQLQQVLNAAHTGISAAA